MSITSGRIAEFLSRAQNINEKAKIIEKVRPQLTPIRTISSSPISQKRFDVSSIAHESFSSTHDDTPIPTQRKILLSTSFPTKKNFSVPPKEKSEKIQSRLPVTKEKNEFPSNRESISSEISSKKATEISQIPQIKEIQAKNKKKMQRMIEIFKEEALKTDQKLKQLQTENKSLREILQSPQLPSLSQAVRTANSVIESLSSKEALRFDVLLENLCKTSRRILKKPEDYEKKIQNWFECLEISPDDYPDFLSSVSAKIGIEQRRRLQAEEEASKFIETEENYIKELERRIQKSEKLIRTTSNKLISDHFEAETEELDRKIVSNNLKNLIFKKSSFGIED